MKGWNWQTRDDDKESIKPKEDGDNMSLEEEREFLLNQRDSESEKFHNYFDEICSEKYGPKVLGNIVRDWIYIYQDRAAFQAIRQVYESGYFNPAESHLLDVGSKFYAVLFFAGYFPTTYIEPRLNDQTEHAPLTFPQLNMSFIRGEAQGIPCQDNAFQFITCLHALEHFGLGRYGDTLDYYGDQKALEEFNRVLKPGGQLILSVPASEDPRIEFNGQRVYSPEIIDSMLEKAGFKVNDRAYITSLGLRVNPETGELLEPFSKDRETLALLESRDQQAAYMAYAQKV